MKEIGEKLKSSRESIGVNIEEAAADLKVKKEILEAIESGDKEPFKDIFYLKELLKNYSYTYDSRGNILSKTKDNQTTTYTYDSTYLNRLSSFGTTQFIYNPQKPVNSFYK